MNNCIKKIFLLSTLIAGLGSIPAGRLTAQTITTIYNFTGGSDGANPGAGLILSGNTLYGTTSGSISGAGNGTVFAVNKDGTGFTNLYSFTALSGSYPYTNSDGAFPYAGLILSGNALYGTANNGGSSGNGTVFKVDIDGTGFTNLHSFTATSNDNNFNVAYTNSDGANPAGLILSGNTLYGTTYGGDISGNGNVFAVNTDGTGFTNLHSFTPNPGSLHTNSDGANPEAGLVLSGKTLYGTAYGGGSSGAGTVFAVNTDGTGFTNLHNCTYGDGSNPEAGLILSGNTLYGTTFNGGSSHVGTVFAVNTDGTGFTNLHSFIFTPDPTDSNGANPEAGLILSGNTLYGTAFEFGRWGFGTVFAVNTDGTGFTNLHSFTGGTDGANPVGGLILSGDSLYGTAPSGGSSSYGTVYTLSLPPPQLTILQSGTNVVLSWPISGATGFNLQSTTNLVSLGFWSAVSPGPTFVNGQNAVTNPISGSRNFYRLSQ